jgi:TIR domain
MAGTPAYFQELAQYVEEQLEDATALIGALAALLGDPETYGLAKGRPLGALEDFIHELLLRDRALGEFIRSPETPVFRILIDGKWAVDWRKHRNPLASEHPSPEFDVCISFAGEDREIAKRIASLVKRNGMKRKVFYDDFEKVTLWGEELTRYLRKIYSEQSKYCIVLFSHAYARRVWTRHEYRAALTRVVREEGAYILPVALDIAAVPEEFSSVGYWAFIAGDERKIAKAIEEKIGEYLQRHYFTIDEMVEIISASRTANAILDGFRAGILDKAATGDHLGAQILTVLALIVGADTDKLDKSVRALIDLVLFAPGVVGDSFEGDSMAVVGTASISRHLGTHGPLLFSVGGWEQYIEPYRISEDDESDPNSDDQQSNSDSADLNRLH